MSTLLKKRAAKAVKSTAAAATRARCKKAAVIAMKKHPQSAILAKKAADAHGARL
jgi:hypothetical protein